MAAPNARYPAFEPPTRLRDLLEDPTVDAVVIATPVSTHFELAMAALRAGKHVMVEKPMTATSDAGAPTDRRGRDGAGWC